MDKFKNKYRIPSARAAWWNYAAEAAYFITICTHNREYFFGNVVDNEMVLSEIGAIVNHEWAKTFDLRNDMNVQLGEFVVMPNHFHAIVAIGANDFNQKITAGNKFTPQFKNLSSLVRGFKGAVTSRAQIIQPSFAWQTRFHDHIIRDDDEYSRIAEYIHNNPAKWSDDRYFGHSALSS